MFTKINAFEQQIYSGEQFIRRRRPAVANPTSPGLRRVFARPLEAGRARLDILFLGK